MGTTDKGLHELERMFRSRPARRTFERQFAVFSAAPPAAARLPPPPIDFNLPTERID